MLLINILITATLIGLISQPLVIQWAKQGHYFDPADDRKTHQGQISSLGGIGWLVGFLAPTIFLSDQAFLMQALPLFLSILLLFGVSLWDDFKPLSAVLRLGVQLLIAIYLCANGWVLPIGWCSFPVSVFFILLMINAYNFIDGINGLLGTLTLLAFGASAIFLYQQGQDAWAFLCVAGCGSTIAFLRFNFGSKAKVFMGDNGSTIIGLLLSVILIKAVQLPMTSHISDISLVVIPVLLPVLDLVRIVLYRLSQKQSPFNADRQHFHHHFVDNGWKAPQVCRFVTSAILSLGLLCYLTPTLWLQVATITGGFALIFGYALRQQRTLTITTSPKAMEKQLLLPVSADQLRA